jgi:sugar phosphate isomerase/epimerase
MINRRKFLKQTGIASAGLMMKPRLLTAVTNNKSVGLQLYTLREQLPKDLKGTIAKVAAAGYKTVETWQYNKADGFWGLDPGSFGSLLKNNGLAIPSGHFLMDTYFRTGKTDELETYIEAANILGMQYLVIGYISSDIIQTADDYKRVADKFNKIAVICKPHGLKFGYHNHGFEWKEVGGIAFYDTILAETDPSLVHMEMDIYWVANAGQDPVAIIRSHPGRFFAFHIKDMDKTHRELNTEIGKGTIDFKTIMGYAKIAGVKQFIVEQENFIDIDLFVSITESCRYVKDVLHV